MHSQTAPVLPSPLKSFTRDHAFAYLDAPIATVTHAELVSAISNLESALPGAFAGLTHCIARSDHHRGETKRIALDGIRILVAVTNRARLAEVPD